MKALREKAWYVRVALLLGATSVAFVAAGCGGGSEALSKEEYGRQLSQICAEFNATESEIGAIGTVADLVAKGPTLLDANVRAIAKVKELKAPAEIEVQAARYVALAEQMRTLFTELIDAAKANDTAAIQALAAKIEPLDVEIDGIAQNQLGAPACSGEQPQDGGGTPTSAAPSADEPEAAKGAVRLYRDPAGDVTGGKGPDLVGVTISNTSTKVIFRVVFAQAPPLAVSEARIVSEWNDMLLVVVDTPPYGAQPIPQGEWRGADYALGTHGPATTGMMVRLGPGIPEESRRLPAFEIGTAGKAMTFSVLRRALDDPASFRFMVTAAREGSKESADSAPDTGTFRYVLTG